MSDSDSRQARRVGDATRARIDDLADGWKVGPESKAAAESAAAPDEEPGAPAEATNAPESPVQRKKPLSAPPPPGGARAKRESAPPPPPGSPRAKRASAPPPPPGGPRPKRESAPPPPPPGAEASSDPPETLVAASVTSPAREGKPRMRTVATLPRKRGPVGDLLYVKSVIFGVAADKRELSAARAQLAQLGERRDKALADVAREAVASGLTTDDEGSTILDLEEERSRCAGVVANTDEEIAAAGRVRESQVEESQHRLDALSERKKALLEQLEPARRELAKIRRQAADLKGKIKSFDRELEEQKEALPSAEDPGKVEALMAALRADRATLLEDEPEIASEMERVQPTCSELGDAVAELDKEIEEITAEREEGGARTDEVVTSLEARRVVETRKLSDVDKRREVALTELGELLADREVAELSTVMAVVERLDGEIAAQNDRVTELDERLSAIDRVKLVRGILLLVLIFGAVAAAAIFLIPALS